VLASQANNLLPLFPLFERRLFLLKELITDIESKGAIAQEACYQMIPEIPTVR
jgi:hypothetical protein